MDIEMFTEVIRDTALELYKAIHNDVAEIYLFVPTHDVSALIDIDKGKKLLQFIVRLDSNEDKCLEYVSERFAKELL